MFSIIFVLVFLLTSCTVQDAVNIDLFIERLSEKYPVYNAGSDKMFFENNKCVLFTKDENGINYSLELTSDLQGNLYKISLACIETDKADLILNFAKNLVSVYAPTENRNAVISNLRKDKLFSFYETDWYSYAFSETENGLFFSVENKRFTSEDVSVLTLKNNKEITLGN